MDVVLASKSPRRREILSRLIDDFIVEDSKIKEEVNQEMDPFMVPVTFAIAKAGEVSKRHPNDIVIGADTIVLFQNKILGKPKTKKEAKEMLSALSDNTHLVITGCAIYYKDKLRYFYETTSVHFNYLDEETIDKYIETGSPMDKAGAYGIQDKKFNLVDYYDGDYDNIMGLPLSRLKKELKDFLTQEGK